MKTQISSGRRLLPALCLTFLFAVAVPNHQAWAGTPDPGPSPYDPGPGSNIDGEGLGDVVEKVNEGTSTLGAISDAIDDFFAWLGIDLGGPTTGNPPTGGTSTGGSSSGGSSSGGSSSGGSSSGGSSSGGSDTEESRTSYDTHDHSYGINNLAENHLYDMLVDNNTSKQSIGKRGTVMEILNFKVTDEDNQEYTANVLFRLANGRIVEAEVRGNESSVSVKPLSVRTPKPMGPKQQPQKKK